MDPAFVEIIGSGLLALGLPGYYLTRWFLKRVGA
jgi:hypothetical protein